MAAFTVAPHGPWRKDEEEASAEVSDSVEWKGWAGFPSFPQRPGEHSGWEGYTPGAI